MMAHIKFKPYIGKAEDGTPTVYRCDHLDETDLIRMLAKPKHLKPISFQAAHQIYGDLIYELMNDPSGKGIQKAIDNANKGFIDVLEDMGYRIVPTLEEIEIF